VKLYKKIAATRAALFDSNMHQIVCRLGLRPRPHWGSLQRRGKGREGKGRAHMTLWHGAPNVLIRPCRRQTTDRRTDDDL